MIFITVTCFWAPTMQQYKQINLCPHNIRNTITRTIICFSLSNKRAQAYTQHTSPYVSFIQLQNHKSVCSLKSTVPVNGVGYSRLRTHTLSLSLQDYDMLLIATIISDSLPENWALLLGAWGPASQNTKKWEGEKETETHRGKGHIERVSEWWRRGKRRVRVEERETETLKV